MLVSVSRLAEDPNNSRSEIPGAEVEEHAEDIRLRGILQPLVVHLADGEGRHRILFGAKRLRAAIRARCRRFLSLSANCPLIATHRSPKARSATV